jgi:glutamate racemase
VTRLLVFDSGVGGLSVAREIRRRLPDAEIVYVADDAGFPYGDWEEAALSNHVVDVIAGLIGRHAPDAVVIACNTASTLVLPPLRARFAIPFVGTVPAIKPAAEQTRSGLVSVLATVGTMRRDYTRDLIRSFARSCEVRLVGSDRLAPIAEAFVRGEQVDDDLIRAEIAPAFVEAAGRRTDMVVLACTHYPFLVERFRRLAPWPLTWIDPAPAIARRVVDVVGAVGRPECGGRGRALLSSGRRWPVALEPVLSALGLDTTPRG